MIKAVGVVREVDVKVKYKSHPLKVVDGPNPAVDIIRQAVGYGPDGGPDREHFIVLALDSKHACIGYRIVHTGSVNECMVHAREVFRFAILMGAAAVIVGHNHPSGSAKPSPDDFTVTARMKEAGELLSIKVLDSIVVTDDAHYSFAGEETL